MAVIVRSGDYYSSLGSNYEVAYGHDQSLLNFLEKLKTHIPPQSQILDVGCGTGKPVASTLAAAGHHVTGIDFSETMLELSREAVPSGNFQNVDIRRYEPPAGFQFNVIASIMSHFSLSREEVEEEVKRWSRWLPVGGILCVSTVTAENYDLETHGGKYDEDGRCARGIKLRFMGGFSISTLLTRVGWENLLAAKGFETVDSWTEDYVPPKGIDSEKSSHYYNIARKIR